MAEVSSKKLQQLATLAAARNAWNQVAGNRIVIAASAWLVLFVAAWLPGFSQPNRDLQTFFREDLELSQDQIAAIRDGQPVAKKLPSRTPAELFLFGAVYIHAAPESYLRFARDFDRLRQLPNYLALGVFSTPPRLSDLQGFFFDSDGIQASRVVSWAMSDSDTGK